MHKTDRDHLHQKRLFRPEDQCNDPSRTDPAISENKLLANRTGFWLEIIFIKSLSQNRRKQRSYRASRRKLWKRVLTRSPFAKVVFTTGSHGRFPRRRPARAEQWLWKRIRPSYSAWELNTKRRAILACHRAQVGEPATEAIANGCLKRAAELKARF